MNKILKKDISVEKIYRILTFAFLVLLVVWRIPLLNKGIDYTDTGFNMTGYRTFFDDVSSNSIGMFLTNLIGAFMYDIIPSGQLLVFRILHLVMWTATYLLVYFTFRSKNNSLFNVVFAFLLLLVSSYQKIGEAIYSYYPFSMLMVALATYFMYTALIKDKKGRLIISGVIVGLNVGVRLPNILFFSLVIAVFWYNFCQKQTKKGFTRSGMMIGGMVIGTGVVVVLELLIIGFGAVSSSLADYTKLASSSSQDHGIINQIIHIFEQIYLSAFNIAFYICPIVLVGFIFLLIYKTVFKKHMHKNSVKLLMYAIIGMMAILWFKLFVNGRITEIKFLHDFGLIALVVALISVFALKKHRPELSTAAVIAIMSSGCIVVGTDLGITRFVDVLPQLCMALLIGGFYLVPRCKKEELAKKRIVFALYFNKVCKTVISVLLGLTVIISLFTMLPFVYNDGKYSTLTASTSDNIVALRGMKTTPKRAESFNNLYYAMTDNENIKDKKVVSVGMFPLLFNIVDNENYFSYPCIDYNSVSIVTLQEEYERNKNDGIYPVIVISRLHMLRNGLSNYCEEEEKVALIEQMLSDCKYTLEFSDENFDVYVPLV